MSQEEANELVADVVNKTMSRSQKIEEYNKYRDTIYWTIFPFMILFLLIFIKGVYSGESMLTSLLVFFSAEMAFFYIVLIEITQLEHKEKWRA